MILSHFAAPRPIPPREKERKARAEAAIPNAMASGRIGIVPLSSASSCCLPSSSSISPRGSLSSRPALSPSLSTCRCAPLDLFKCVNLPSDLKCHRVFSHLFFSLCRAFSLCSANLASLPSSVANERMRLVNTNKINSAMSKENWLFQSH